jgi:hypothetical protein
VALPVGHPGAEHQELRISGEEPFELGEDLLGLLGAIRRESDLEFLAERPRVSRG